MAEAVELEFLAENWHWSAYMVLEWGEQDVGAATAGGRLFSVTGIG